MRQGYRLSLFLLLLALAGAGSGCANKRYATQPYAPPTTGQNPIITGMQGAGRTIVDGTKKGFRSARNGIQKWVDPASASEPPLEPELSRQDLDDSTLPKSSKGKTVVQGNRSDEYDASNDRRSASKGRSSGTGSPSTRVGSRNVGTKVADTFVIE